MAGPDWWPGGGHCDHVQAAVGCNNRPALCLVLGGISAIFEAQYPGIAIQAIGLTFGTLGVLLFAYKSG